MRPPLHWFANKLATLQSKHSSHETKEGHRGARDNNASGSRVGTLGVSSSGSARDGSALGLGDIVLDVGRLGLAEVEALDDLGLLVAVELGAGEVAGGLGVEGTADISELWERSPGMCQYLFFGIGDWKIRTR